MWSAVLMYSVAGAASGVLLLVAAVTVGLLIAKRFKKKGERPV